MSTPKLRAAAAILSLIAVLLIVTNNGIPSSAASGLLNPGFEDGALDGNPAGWTVVNPVADVVRVVDTEGPGEFPTYVGMGNVTISPHRGNLMLRTGTPQRLAQNQNKGNNLVRQTFSSTSSSLDFAFRVFSWEHRGQDLAKFDIKDGPTSVGSLAAPLQIQDANGAVIATCTGIPCEIALNAGVQGQFLDTGWRVVSVVGLPADGRNLTVSYQVTSTKDASHATWAYWDNVNTPPVAKFTFEPCSLDEITGQCTDNPIEGDLVQFIDLSYDPDPGDSIVSRTWVIDGQTFTSDSPFFLFPDEANYVASISVTDTYGSQTIVLDSATALDGDVVPDLVVENARPLVNALNMQVLEGHEFTLRGRHLDTGYLDTHAPDQNHSTAWSLNGATAPAAFVEEENAPLLSTGLVTGKLTATAGLTGGTLTVDDGDLGGIAQDSFTIEVVPDIPLSRNRHEPNDTILDPPLVRSDNAILSFLQEDGDIDIYEVGAAVGPVKPGSEILVSATNLAADIDIAILSKLPTNASDGWSHLGWQHGGWQHGGWQHGGWQHGGWQHGGWQHGGWQHGGLGSFSQSGVSWTDIGYYHNGQSQSGYLAGGNEVGVLDVDLAELGLGTVGGDDLQVFNFSANRGLDDEVAWARSAVTGTKFYVAVFTSDGEQSVSPYTLSVEIIEPPDLEVDLGPLCDGSAPVTPATDYEILYDYDNPLTPENDAADAVLITQKQRLQRDYGMDEAAFSDFMGFPNATSAPVGLIDLAQLDKARADILSAPSFYFDQFDDHPCVIEAANSAATRVRGLVNTLYPNVKHRVVVGNDSIIPFMRKLDHTVIGNEKDYLLDSFTKAGSPLFAALLQGYMITDDHLGEGVDAEGDPTSNPWQGEEAYVPTIGVGRLVETPQEILWHVQAAVESNLTLQPSSAAVFGYDFFTDGTGLIRDDLQANGLAVADKTDGLWTKEDLRCLFLGIGADANCGVRDIVSPNGHATHWAVLAAAGYGNGENIDFTDSIESNEVAALGNGTQPLKNTMVFAMGCHMGFNSPDAFSEGPEPGTTTSPAMDFPQAFAQHGAISILSNGFSYGDDEGVGGHEKLFSILPNEMFAPGATVGQALAAAKQQYLQGLVTISVYDFKASMETTLYGLPMYTVEPVAAASTLLAVQTQESLSSGTPAGTFELATFDEGGEVPAPSPITYQMASNESPVGKGIYYTLDGEAEGAIGHTLQPSFEVDVVKRHYPSGAQPTKPVHGVRILGATYRDEANDPVFTRPKDEWDLYSAEEQQCQAGYSPSELAKVNSFQRGPKLTQTLVGVAGQFRCMSSGPPVTGIERVYTSLSLELRRCDGDNVDGPMINDLELRDLGGGTVEVRIDAEDIGGGLTRVEVLRVDEGQIVPFTVNVDPPVAAGVFNINVPSVERATDLLIQVEDTDCNVTLDTFKSAGLNFLKVDAGPDQMMPANRTVTLTGTIENFGDLTSPAWFDWEFGDGTFTDGVLLPADKRSGVDSFFWDQERDIATFTVQHPYAAGLQTPITATLEVHDSAGGNGSDETHIVCDPTGDAQGPDGDWVGCASSNTITKITISVTVDAPANGGFQYRVYVDAGKYNTKRKRWDQPPDGTFDALLKYNSGQVSGLPSLTVQVIGNQLNFTFNLAEFGLSTGKEVRWYAETQAGIPGEPATGKVDRMPDAGWLRHSIQ